MLSNTMMDTNDWGPSPSSKSLSYSDIKLSRLPESPTPIDPEMIKASAPVRPQVDPQVVWALSTVYIFTNYQSVSLFLYAHPSCAFKLLDCYKHIGLIWGQGTPTRLNIVTDPHHSEAASLVVHIQSCGSLDAALDKLSDFTRRCLINSRGSDPRELVFDVEGYDAI